MEVSEEIQGLLQKYRVHSRQHIEPVRCDTMYSSSDSDHMFNIEDIIEVNEIDMNNDQTWLITSSDETLDYDAILDANEIRRFLYDTHDTKTIQTQIREISKLQNSFSKKNIVDTRTFTRPKKKFTRQSIEKYNADYFNEQKNDNSMLSEEIDNYITTSYNEVDDLCNDSSSRPLHFDLSQPMSSSSIFDKILNTSGDLDSFQNMSPPSLVNSMCSSTFTNLMENSYIKNDPVLREIRDADFSGVLLQDADPPLFQSFTESCSSINSDTAESFLRRTLTTLNGTFKMNASTDVDYKSTPDSDSQYMDAVNKFDSSNDDSFVRNGIGTPITNPTIHDQTYDTHSENIDPNTTMNISPNVLNGTFRKNNNSKLNSTYQKHIDNNTSFDINKTINTTKEFNKTQELNKTTDINNELSKTSDYFNKTQELNMPELDKSQYLNNTIDLNKTTDDDDNKTNELFKAIDLNKTTEICADFKQLINSKLNHTITLDSDEVDQKKINDQINMKRLSYNIDDLQQTDNDKLNSTYDKDHSKNNTNRLSLGSTDSLDRMSSVSNSSRDSGKMHLVDVDAMAEIQERSLLVMSTPKPAKSLSKLFDHRTHNLSPIPQLNLKQNLSDSEMSSDDYVSVKSRQSVYSDKLKSDRAVRSLNNLRTVTDTHKPRCITTITSGSNLKTFNSKLKGSYSDIKTASSQLRGSYSNLKTINPSIKGSYTNLKPFNSNLPNIQPPKSYHKPEFNSQTYARNGKSEVFKMPSSVEANSTFVKPPSEANSTFIKPQPRVSGLPRPISSSTGIPRPSMSKIPAPKSARVSSAKFARPSGRYTTNDGFY